MSLVRAGVPTFHGINLKEGILPRVGALGDSITAISNSTTSGFNNWNLQGWCAWLRILSKQSILMTKDYIFAATGLNTSTAISGGYLASAVAARLDVYIVALGVNDAQGLTSSQFSSNLNTICTALLGTGAIVILQTILPNTECTSAEMKVMHAMNRIIREKAKGSTRIILSDPTPYFIDHNSAAGAPVSGLLYDTVHPNNKGAYLIAKKHWETLSKYIPAYERRFLNPSDVWASDNINGNLLSNGMLSGSGGTYESSVGLSGSVADSWNFVMNPNASVGTATGVLSKVSRTDENGSWQRVVLSGTPTAPLQYIFQQNLTSNFSAGETVELAAEFKLASGSTGIQAVWAQIYDATGSVVGKGDGLTSTGHEVYTGDNIHGVLMPERHTITANPGTVQINFGIQTNNAALSATIDLGPISLRKI